jgi:hypothetical protein
MAWYLVTWRSHTRYLGIGNCRGESLTGPISVTATRGVWAATVRRAERPVRDASLATSVW